VRGEHGRGRISNVGVIDVVAGGEGGAVKNSEREKGGFVRGERFRLHKRG
jgi:hypothetical protein